MVAVLVLIGVDCKRSPLAVCEGMGERSLLSDVGCCRILQSIIATTLPETRSR